MSGDTRCKGCTGERWFSKRRWYRYEWHCAPQCTFWHDGYHDDACHAVKLAGEDSLVATARRLIAECAADRDAGRVKSSLENHDVLDVLEAFVGGEQDAKRRRSGIGAQRES